MLSDVVRSSFSNGVFIFVTIEEGMRILVF